MTARPWRVLIVEDDPMVAYLHRRLVSSVPAFEVVGIVNSGEKALSSVLRRPPHLILLDIGLPGIDGVTFLRELRTRSLAVEVIAVTAARSADVVRDTLHLGVLDYLVKPFTFERLRQSLMVFMHRMGALGRLELEQETIDIASQANRRRTRCLPKGLAEETLAAVRTMLANAEHALSADEVATGLGFGRVTVRRYLEYLSATGEVVSDADRSRPGRPRNLYRRQQLPGLAAQEPSASP